MDFLNLDNILKVAKNKGYQIFDRELELNNVGIRTLNTDADTFNDYRILFRKSNGAWQQFIHSITTDPGLFYRNNPMNKKGTAILKEGQMIGGWMSSYHKGKAAWVQKSYLTVIRDFDKDMHLDIIYNDVLIKYKRKEIKDYYQTVEWLDDRGKVVYREQTGLFGVDHHQAGVNSTIVGNWSAGCQVTAKKSDHSEFMKLTKEYIKLYSNSLSYILLNERDFING